MEVFKQSPIWGTRNLVWSQAYYDTGLWEKKLRDHLGSESLISTSRHINCPKVSFFFYFYHLLVIVSTVSHDFDLAEVDATNRCYWRMMSPSKMTDIF